MEKAFNDKLTAVFDRLSLENENVLYGLPTDIDAYLPDKDAERIKAHTFEKLNLSLNKERNSRRFSFVKIAVCVCIAFLVAVTTVCAVNEPIRDRIIRIFTDSPVEEEDTVPPYLQSPEYTPTVYEVTPVIDFGEFDFSTVDRILIVSGMTGDEKYIDNSDVFLQKIQAISGHSPVSSRGRSGFNYSIKLFEGAEEVCRFGIYSEGDNYYFFYGVYEEFRGIEYSCFYTSDIAVEELKLILDEFFKSDV